MFRVLLPRYDIGCLLSAVGARSGAKRHSNGPRNWQHMPYVIVYTWKEEAYKAASAPHLLNYHCLHCARLSQSEPPIKPATASRYRLELIASNHGMTLATSKE